MRQTSDADAEAWVLTSEPGRVLPDEVAATSHYGPTELQRWRRTATPEQVAAAVRLTLARVRGKAKFSRAAAMWFEPVGLEQATAEPVARHKARRFREAHLLDLLRDRRRYFGPRWGTSPGVGCRRRPGQVSTDPMERPGL